MAHLIRCMDCGSTFSSVDGFCPVCEERERIYRERRAEQDRQMALALQERQNKLLAEKIEQDKKLAEENARLAEEKRAAEELARRKSEEQARKAEEQIRRLEQQLKSTENKVRIAEENAAKQKRQIAAEQAKMKTCQWCGKKYVYPDSVAKDKLKFCGRKCEVDFQTDLCSNLSGEELIELICNDVSIFNRCPTNKFSLKNWKRLITVHPALAASCPWDKFSQAEQRDLLKKCPQIIKYISEATSWLTAGDWMMLISQDVSLLNECRTDIFSLEDWKTLIIDNPALAASCPWNKFSRTEQRDLLKKCPQIIKYTKKQTPWLTLKDWAKLISRDASLFSECPTEKFTQENWISFLLICPECIKQSPYRKFTDKNWETLLGAYPEMKKYKPVIEKRIFVNELGKPEVSSVFAETVATVTFDGNRALLTIDNYADEMKWYCNYDIVNKEWVGSKSKGRKEHRLVCSSKIEMMQALDKNFIKIFASDSNIRWGSHLFNFTSQSDRTLFTKKLNEVCKLPDGYYFEMSVEQYLFLKSSSKPKQQIIAEQRLPSLPPKKSTQHFVKTEKKDSFSDNNRNTSAAVEKAAVTEVQDGSASPEMHNSSTEYKQPPVLQEETEIQKGFSDVDCARVLFIILSFSAGLLFLGGWMGLLAGLGIALIPFAVLEFIKDKEKQKEASGFLLGALGLLNGEILFPGWVGLGVGLGIAIVAFVVLMICIEASKNKQDS